MPREFSIELPYITQRVVIGSNISEEELLKIAMSFAKVIILIDVNVLSTSAKDLLEALEAKLGKDQLCIIKLFPEKYFKSLEYTVNVASELVTHSVTRNTLLVAIGGGFVGDIGGFLASVYMRGISFVQLGTTLMSQVDAIIGKVAVNVGHRKNVVGSFFSPQLTICDQALIKDDRHEALLAMAEIFKHYVISISSLENLTSKVEALQQAWQQDDFGDGLDIIIEESLKIKASIVMQDPYDRNGIHKMLSFGHTFANILETELHMRHGEAVWIGMHMATQLALAANVAGINQNFCDYLLKAIDTFFPRKEWQKHSISKANIEALVLSDKITTNKQPTFIIVTKPGNLRLVHPTISEVLAVFHEHFTLI